MNHGGNIVITPIQNFAYTNKSLSNILKIIPSQ